MRSRTYETQREISSTKRQLTYGLGKGDTDKRKEMEKQNSAETRSVELTKNVPHPRSLPLPTTVDHSHVISPPQSCETRAASMVPQDSSCIDIL